MAPLYFAFTISLNTISPESLSGPLQCEEVSVAHTTRSQSEHALPLPLAYQLSSLILILNTSIFPFQLDEKHLVKNTRPVFAHSKYVISTVFLCPSETLISLYDVHFKFY